MTRDDYITRMLVRAFGPNSKDATVTLPTGVVPAQQAFIAAVKAGMDDDGSQLIALVEAEQTEHIDQMDAAEAAYPTQLAKLQADKTAAEAVVIDQRKP